MKKDAKILKTALIRLGCAAVLVAVSVLLWRYSNDRKMQDGLYDIKTVPPTCTDSGYTLYTDRETGEVTVADVVEATGHSFAPWTVNAQPQGLQPGSRSRTCAACSLTEEEAVYPELTVPLIALDGSLEGIGKKEEVSVDALFYSADREFTSFATLKYQGHESLQFDKKNYTLKFWTDENTAQKNKLEFSHWNPENKYILKANYIDPTACRNLVSADVWAAVTASRDGLPERFEALSNYGAVDGFPIALYMNEQFQGLYTMNLHKDDDLFGMSDGEEEAVLIANHTATPDAYFRSTSDFGDSSAWEVEFCGTEDSTWAQDKLNALITFVMESDEDSFRRDLNQYLDVDSAVDHLLSIYALGLTNHGASDLVLVTYGQDEPFTASLYDMETAFGLSADGKEAAAPEVFLPYQQGGVWSSDTQNLLWDRLLQSFYPELCARYSQLREAVFDPDALCTRVTDYTAAIDETLYEANDAACPGFPTAAESIEQITQYISQRIRLLDEIFMLKEGPNK